MKSKIPITVDDDPELEYEKNRWTDVCKWPLMWLLAFWVALKKKILGLIGLNPKINTFWFDGLSPVCRVGNCWKLDVSLFSFREVFWI